MSKQVGASEQVSFQEQLQHSPWSHISYFILKFLLMGEHFISLLMLAVIFISLKEMFWSLCNCVYGLSQIHGSKGQIIPFGEKLSNILIH